ncbi:response regulator [Catellatospora chokoriensis]|uniref:DNA-binding response regulator n=1 Tax=Catellatospora chokoriensis TaxID=310353 RepID=A0A8J3JRH3_9ACTN|nr:response regulator transcription factor [Catellatospora chokoriensis]GIF89747.1 DNA-binding response regulator [Catellatospora chokoriensis]
MRVLIVDDQPLVRAGLEMILSSQPDMTVAGQAGDGAEAVRLVGDLAGTAAAVDVVVMDIRMPIMDGVEATRLLSAAGPTPRVIVLTTFDGDADAFAALQAGASGFLLKNAPPEELLAALRAVAGGDAVVAPRVTRRLLEHFAGRFVPPPAPDSRVAALTDREREVVLAVAAGLSNAEIAGELVVAEATVKTHVGRILTKLGLRDRVQVVVFAYESGLVRPGPGAPGGR